MHNNKGVVKKTFTAPFSFAFAPEKAKLLFEAQRRARVQLPLARRIFWEENDLWQNLWKRHQASPSAYGF